MLFIYSLLFFYYFGFSFEHFGISRLAHIGDLLAILLPFLLSVIFLGIVMGLVISKKELATVIVLLTSLPLVFSAGFIWPASNIPTWINVVTQFFPSTPAINAFLRLNQMGDSMESVKGLWQQLWLLTCLFFAVAYLLMVKKQHQLKESLKKPLA
jgi:ABC-2 type transport system permease protein